MSTRSVVEPTPGVARARNTAIEKAKGRILLWLDDDVRAPRDWLQKMTRPLLQGEADAVAGKVDLAPHLVKPWMQKFHRTALASTDSIDPEDPKNIISANMAFARSVLQKVPGFDPELGPGGRVGALEDTLFSWQLREAGYCIAMVTAAPVVHHFDPDRLTRDAFIDAAAARGRSLSYIRYHWSHHQESSWTHRTRLYQVWRHPYIVLAKRLLDRGIRYGRHCITSKVPVIDRGEFWTILNVYSLRQYLVEQQRPRSYRKRGLKKMHGPVSSLETRC